MFGIGMPELMLIFALALLVFGPKELPKIARTIGKAMGELRRASDELRDGIQREIDLADREEEPPSSPPETVPSAAPASEAHAGPAGVDSLSGASGVSPDVVAAEASTETISQPSGEQATQIADQETAETTEVLGEAKPGELKGGQEVPPGRPPKAETPSTASIEPAETRNV
jgi:sec-independent protein translocase protein TatB